MSKTTNAAVDVRIVPGTYVQPWAMNGADRVPFCCLSAAQRAALRAAFAFDAANTARIIRERLEDLDALDAYERRALDGREVVAGVIHLE